MIKIGESPSTPPQTQVTIREGNTFNTHHHCKFTSFEKTFKHPSQYSPESTAKSPALSRKNQRRALDLFAEYIRACPIIYVNAEVAYLGGILELA